MKKKLVVTIENCLQCSWSKKGGENGLLPYFCGYGGGFRFALLGLGTIPEECGLEDAVPNHINDIVEPGC